MNLKRILTTILTVVIAISCVGFADEAESVVPDVSWFECDGEYILDSTEDILGFAKLVNEGNSFSGKTIKLSCDIDLAGINDWVPIGTSTQNPFKGTFDGDNNTIKNLSVTRDAAYGNGFFGNILSGGIVKNITFDNILIRRYEDESCSGNVYGIVTGYTYGSTLFENVTVKNSKIVGFGKVAALIGMSAEPGEHITSLINCTVENTEVKGTYNVAGLVGTVLNNNVIMTGSSIKNVTWTSGDEQSAYSNISGTLEDGTEFDGLYWIYSEDDIYTGWSDFYNDWYIQYKGNGYITEGVDADGLCHNAEVLVSGYAYESLAFALEMAEKDSGRVTITLLRDITTNETLTFKKDITLDLGGKTFTPKGVNEGDGWNINITNGANVKFTNGTVDLSGVSGGWHGVFGIGKGSLAFDDTISVTGDGVSGNIFALTTGESTLAMNGTIVDIQNHVGGDGTYFIKSEPDSGIPNAAISGAEIKISGGQGFINNTNADISGSKITLADMKQHGLRNVSGNIKDTLLEIDTTEDGIKNTGEQALEIGGESIVKISAENAYNISENSVLSMTGGKFSVIPENFLPEEFITVFDESEQLYVVVSAKATITFNTNGGEEISPAEVDSNKVIDLSEYLPKKSGYTFLGWYADEELTEKVTEISLLSDKTLYAAWKKKKSGSAGLTGPMLSSPVQGNNNIVLIIGEKEAQVFGKKVLNDVAPVIINNRTMLHIRFVAEALGAAVSWNEEMREVTISTDKTTIIIKIDSDKALVNEKEVTLDAVAFVENDRTYLPLRFISEELGAKVTYDEKDKKVTIIKQ